ncbi:MAG: hypothetical protein ACU4EQ_03960 [Candidatus Nitrosoglobus sp.]|jgi:hypothetical protein
MNEKISLNEEEMKWLMEKAIDLAKHTHRPVNMEMKELVEIYVGYRKGSRPWLMEATSKVFSDIPPLSPDK